MGVRITAYVLNPIQLSSRAEELGLVGLESSTDRWLRLERLAQSPAGAPLVTLLSANHRRWWIGSLLAACRAQQPASADLLEIERLFARMMRGYDVGAPLPADAASLGDIGFSWAPRADEDLRMALLSADERWLLGTFLRERLQESRRIFARPAGSLGIAPEAPEDWDAWVRTAANELAAPEPPG